MTKPTPADTTAPIDALGLAELPPAEQEELLLELSALIFRGSLVRLMERMDESARADFAALMETDPSEADLERFLTERVPDASAAVEETVADLTGDILAVNAT